MRSIIVTVLLILACCIGLAMALMPAHADPIHYQGSLTLQRPFPIGSPLSNNANTFQGAGDLKLKFPYFPFLITGSFQSSFHSPYALSAEDQFSAGLAYPVANNLCLFGRYERRFRLDDDRVVVGITTRFKGGF